MNINDLNLGNFDQKSICQIATKIYREKNIFDIKPDMLTPNMYDKSLDFYFLPEYGDGTKINSGFPDYYNIDSIRRDFPILQKKIDGKPLVWLDNAATTQKPKAVIDAISSYYINYNSNVHRGAHTLSKIATQKYEEAREKIKNFIGASHNEEIIFVRGTTEAINLVANSYGKTYFGPKDVILLSSMEHHSNIVPWQIVQKETGCQIKIIPINDKGEILLDEYRKLLTPHTKLVAITHVSNVLGTINPVKDIVRIAHDNGTKVLIDGAQSVPHLKINVQNLDVDFYTLSGHKLYGPMGIGALYIKKEILDLLPPWQGGGGMIDKVTFDETTYNKPPLKFEAGTGSVADAVGLGTAIDYIQKIGRECIEAYEKNLTTHAMKSITNISGLRIIGTSENKTSVISFLVDNISSETIAQHLSNDGIAVRSGCHCAEPTMQRFGIKGTVRISLGLYNSVKDIDFLVYSLHKLLS